MEQVDDIIILSLREIGCDIDENIKSLSSFEPELCVKSVAMLIKVVNPQLEVPKLLPPGMAQRFQVTTQLAETCTKMLNYKGDLGYQTFLYSNVIELRRLFMWLIERMPKEERETVQKTTTDKTKIIENEIMKNLLEQLRSPWLFEFQENHEQKMFLPNNLHLTDTLNCNDEALIEYKRKYEPTIYQQSTSSSGNNLLSSLIHTHDSQMIASNYNYVDKLSNLKFKTSSSSFDISLMSSPKKIASEKVENVGESEKVSQAPRKLSESEILEEEIEELKNQIEVEETQQKGLLIEQEQIQEKLSQVSVDFEKLKNKKRVAERTAMLLDEPEVNEQRLLEMIEVSKRKMESLREQWEEHKKPLQEKIDANENQHSSKKFQIDEVLSEMKTVKQKTQTIVEDIKFKTQLHQELLVELQNANKNVQRISYTSRIIDIIGSIKKQNDDIEKILADTRDLQKSINTLQGQLSRQYKVTDDLLFQNARKDEFAKKCYKLLVTLHASFNDLIVLCENTGAISREIRDIEEQIENERGKNIKKNLQQITNDLQEMQMECEKLEYKIKLAEEGKS